MPTRVLSPNLLKNEAAKDHMTIIPYDAEEVKQVTPIPDINAFL
jgi:hypothetical protein